MPNPALSTLRRMQRTQERRTLEALAPAPRKAAIPRPGPREGLTREAFLGLVYAALGRVAGAYAPGTLALLSKDELEAIDEAEGRVDRASLDGDFEAAREGLKAWERTWTETLRRRREGRRP